MPPTGVTGGTDWAEALRDHATPCDRVTHNEKAYLPDPVYDTFWDERDYVTRAKNVTASVLLEGSWADINVHPVNSYEMWRALPAGLPKKLWMGQKDPTWPPPATVPVPFTLTRSAGSSAWSAAATSRS